jgi:LysM repeat protein
VFHELDRKTLTYEVGAFDTLNSIALKFGMTTSEVMRLNKLRSSNVYSGQVRLFSIFENLLGCGFADNVVLGTTSSQQLQVFEPPLRTSRSKSTDSIRTTAFGLGAGIGGDSNAIHAKRTISGGSPASGAGGEHAVSQPASPSSTPSTPTSESVISPPARPRERRPSKSMAERIAFVLFFYFLFLCFIKDQILINVVDCNQQS